MAITGLKTLSEGERYTRAARQSGLADQAVAKLSGRRDGTETGHPARNELVNQTIAI